MKPLDSARSTPSASASSESTGQMSLFGEMCGSSRLTGYELASEMWSTLTGDLVRERATRYKQGGVALHTQVMNGVSISSPPATPASHSLSPGSDWARKMTATYGRKLGDYWLSSGPPDSWVRTLLGTSIWGSMTCYLTWKKSATPQGRLLFRLVPSAPRIAGIGSGLWGTPTGRDHKDTGNMQNVPVNGLLGRQVAQADRLWPTPDVPNGGRGIPKDAVRTGNTIYTADGRKVQEGLANAVKMWPTPRSSPNENRSMKRAPSVAEGKHGEVLAEEACEAEREAGTYVQGMKLNSAWVSRMMGYPDSWMDVGEETQ